MWDRSVLGWVRWLLQVGLGQLGDTEPLGGGTEPRTRRMGTACALSTGDSRASPSAIRQSSAWNFVLNIYKGSGKVYKKR